MKAAPGQAQKVPHLLALFLVTAGAGCLAAAAGLSAVDLPQLVGRRITAAQGTISPETVAWLRDTPFRGDFLGVGLLLLAIGGFFRIQRPAVLMFLSRAAAWKIWQPAWALPAIAVLAVLVRFFPTLSSGFFRYDDFDFLVAAQSGSFWKTFWLPHGDHFLPVMRVLAYVAVQGWGTTAWPYNLWILLCMGAVLAAGILLLRDLQVSRPAQLLFVALMIFWSPWAEMMAGYYVLSIYLLVALLGLVAVRCCLRWLAHRKPADAVVASLCLLLAPLVDISGAYVLGACSVFLVFDLDANARETGPRAWVGRHGLLLAGLLAGTAISFGLVWYDYGQLHRGVFLHMAGDTPRTLLQRAGDLGYLLNAGVLAAMVAPFVYARLPASLLILLLLGVLLLWLSFTAFAVGAADKSRRRTMAAMFLVILGTALMVTLGRPSADSIVVRWAAKHVCPVYLWLCLFLAAGWDALWIKTSALRRGRMAEMTLVALGLFVAAQSAFGLLGMAVAFPPFGYPAEIRDAVRRRAGIALLRREVVGPLAAGGEQTVPTLDGPAIRARIPSLFEYNLSNYRPFFSDLAGPLDFVRNPAMQPDFVGTVRTVPVLRDAVSPSFLELLGANPALRDFYAQEVPLRPLNRAVPNHRQPPAVFTVMHGDSRREVGGDTVIESNGSAEILIRDQSWDPEQAARLQLAIQRLDEVAVREFSVTVIFNSDWLQSDWRGTLALRGAPDFATEVDLRQVYAFSLARKVSHLRVVLHQPGRYVLRQAILSP